MRNLRKIGAVFFAFCLGLALTAPALSINVKALNNKIDMEDRAYVNEVPGFPGFTFIEKSPYTLVEGDSILYFDNEGDYFRYKRNQKVDSSVVVPFHGEKQIVEVVDREVKKQLWIGYHSLTPLWSLTPSYVCHAGRRYFAEGSYQWKNIDFSLGMSYVTGAVITCPADSTKWSRLGIWGNFTFERHKIIEMKYGQPTGYVYYVGVKKMTDYYVGVVYK